MGDVIYLVPVSQSCTGFAQSPTVVVERQPVDMPVMTAVETMATGNVTLLRTAHHMMEAFEATGRAARVLLVSEASAIFGETLDFGRDALQARTFADLLDLHGDFARRRLLSAATFASAFLAKPMPPAYGMPKSSDRRMTA